MKKWILLLCLLSVAMMATDAKAFRLFRRRTSNNNCSNGNCTTGTAINTSDQQMCYNKASRMAAAGRMSHSFGPMAGTFEGVGWSTGPNPGTCTPRRGMRLTGDAIVRSSNGNYYRCRSWR